MSARLGMRGAFETLVQFAGGTLEEKIEFHDAWYQLVERYSVRNITYDRDKLAAMDGITQFIEEGAHFHFVTGLWAETLAFNLLWFVKGDAMRRPERRLPTWSWASVDGCISHRL